MRQNLSAREMDVLQQVVQGATNKEIADALSITENTVKKHLQSILSKLHLQNRIQAAVYAVREGLVNDASLPGQSLFVELLPADMAQVGHILKQNRAELSHLKDGSFLCTKRPGWGCCLASRSAKLGSRGSKKL